MRLLVDAGNSRVKWAVYSAGACVAEGAVAHADADTLATAWAPFALVDGWASNVASADLRARIDAASPVALTWVGAARAAFGVINHYREVGEQGADRWLAVLAARALVDGDVVVACAGTALTVEALTAGGDYLGGLILPGHHLMQQSLARGTARLDREQGEHRLFPQGTSDAIASGIIDAQAGAIERLRARLAQASGRPSPEVVLTGGGAAALAPHVAAPVRIVDNLVLLGLLRVADAS